MTPQEFIIWLEGFLAYNPDLKELNEEQTRRLKEKLSVVFNKVTPDLNGFATGGFVDDSKIIFEEGLAGNTSIDNTRVYYSGESLRFIPRTDLPPISC